MEAAKVLPPSLIATFGFTAVSSRCHPRHFEIPALSERLANPANRFLAAAADMFSGENNCHSSERTRRRKKKIFNVCLSFILSLPV